jgi:hypothetical protein
MAYFEVKTTVLAGWVALGFGSSMRKADVVMCYVRNEKLTVEMRRATSRSLPQLNTNQYISSPTFSDVNDERIYSFWRPLDTGDSSNVIIQKDTMMNMIYAFNTNAMTDHPTQHSTFGTFSLNIEPNLSSSTIPTAPITTNGSNVSHTLDYQNSTRDNTLLFVRIHGALMWISWYLCASFAILTARFFKKRMGKNWFPVHYGLLILAVLLSIVGVIIIQYNVSEHFSRPHHSLGLVVVILSFLQLILGQYINIKFDPNRHVIPWYDKVHWWFGRLIFILANLNIFLGFNIYDFSIGIYLHAFFLAIFFAICIFEREKVKNK